LAAAIAARNLKEVGELNGTNEDKFETLGLSNLSIEDKEDFGACFSISETKKARNE
jgi:hypothetical protein